MLIPCWALVRECRCAKTWYDIVVTFDFGSARIFSTVTFEKYFYYHKNIWLAATGYYCNLYLIVHSPVPTELLLRNLTDENFSLLINTVILLLNCVAFILCFNIHFLSPEH